MTNIKKIEPPKGSIIVMFFNIVKNFVFSGDASLRKKQNNNTNYFLGLKTFPDRCATFHVESMITIGASLIQYNWNRWSLFLSRLSSNNNNRTIWEISRSIFIWLRSSTPSFWLWIEHCENWWLSLTLKKSIPGMVGST